jgi:hypothetical protein
MTHPAAPLRVLTLDQERTIRDAIGRGATDAEAGRAAGVSARRFYAARLAELADIPRHKRGPRVGHHYEPAAEILDLPLDEIYRRAYEIRLARPKEPEPDEGSRRHRGSAGEARPAMPAGDPLEQTHYRRLHASRESEDLEDHRGW